ncbi:MAG: hypothetical protein A3F72_11295 [Bacteroidetes bacterium RIFCSPLOWO2_12_FULL_35_15]|nr:MAG: hypothetical protein A3F72_11295 [Bacteroidetes bacterium RIFCSPLOWO2_12_FULL_35_15]
MKRILFNLATFSLFVLTINAQTPDFGVHWGNAANGTPPLDFTTAVSNLNPNTVKWIRTEISWADIHTAPNTFNWLQIPIYIQTLTDSGYSIIGILKNTPSWYTTNNTGNPVYDPYFAPQDTVEWGKYVDSVVTKFQNQIKYWEIWNEPDGGFFQTTTPLQKHIKFKNLLSSAYNKIKSIDPSAKVLVGGFTTKVMSIPGRKLFLDSLFAVNFQQYFDIMNIHVYELAYELQNINTTIQNNGISNYPLWITETNTWRELDPNNSEINTANYLCNWIHDTLISYFNPQVICWFNLRNFVPSIPAVCDTCDPNLTAYGLLNSQYQSTLLLNAYDSCYSQLTTSVPEEIKNNTTLLIFPNPFSSETTLRTDIFFKETTLTVYNYFGQTVKQIDNLAGRTIIFHQDNLPSGLYFIRLTQDNKVIAADKLVITD